MNIKKNANMSQLRNNGIITHKDYIGKSLTEATEYAISGGYEVRIVEKDGHSFMITMDYKNNRINFRVKGDIVTDVFGG
jgi:hypothetical protein